VLVGFSTTYQAQEDVLRRIVEALASVPVDALVTTGPAVTLDAPLPENVEVAPWVPHSEALPGCNLVITHGGLGTVLVALAHGVPMVCMPMGRDQHGNAARVTRLGAGIELAVDASPTEIAEAIRNALADSKLSRGARRIAADIGADIAADRAVRELEALATTRTQSALT
jgi:MGT family glycosyltransferase